MVMTEIYIDDCEIVEEKLILVHRLKHLVQDDLLEEWEFNQLILHLNLIYEAYKDESLEYHPVKDEIIKENIKNHRKISDFMTYNSDFIENQDEEELESLDEMLWHDLRFMCYFVKDILKEEGK